MVDNRDGQVYKTVRIGEQLWMAENLNYVADSSTFTDGDSAKDANLHGRLYMWGEALRACPEGWHLPSRIEYQALIDYVDSLSTVSTGYAFISESCSYLWTIKYKSSGRTSTAPGSDNFGFSAIPNAENQDSDVSTHALGRFWTSTDASSGVVSVLMTEMAKLFVISPFGTADANLSNYKSTGAAVRCVKTEGNPIESAVESSSSLSLFLSSSSEPAKVDSLHPNLNPFVEYDSITDNRDGRVYKIKKIGKQTWMAENLGYYDTIAYPGMIGRSLCKEDSTGWCPPDGRFYNWAVAMDSAETWSSNGAGCGNGTTCTPVYPVRGICLEGWHLPTKEDWDTLFTAVGGRSKAGQVLKTKKGWYDPYSTHPFESSDRYGFSIYPYGHGCLTCGEDHIFLSETETETADFWTSTEDASVYAYKTYFTYKSNEASTANTGLKFTALSIRCVKDSE